MQRAFTLVELAIVLVIIGLLVGGVLVGQELIVQASYRAQVSDIRMLEDAVGTFRVKYGGMPGDITNATYYFTGASQPDQVTNGNGDGHIGMSSTTITGCDTNAAWGNSNVPAYYVEWFGVFDQLTASGLFPGGQYDEGHVGGNPPLRFTSNGGASDMISSAAPASMAIAYIPACAITVGSNVENTGGSHKIALGAVSPGAALPASQSPGINSWEAYAIDNKVDDGSPYTGAAVIMNIGYLYRNNAQSQCAVTSGANAYRMNQSALTIGGGGMPRTVLCALYISSGF